MKAWPVLGVRLQLKTMGDHRTLGIINNPYHAQCACSHDVADSVAAVQFTKLKW